MNHRSLIVSVLMLLQASRVLACQCGSRPSRDEALKARDLVVTGIVLRQSPAAILRGRFRYSDPAVPRVLPVTKITIGVTRVFKGDPHATITLTHIGCCVCEKDLQTGKEYLLFVSRSWEVRDAQMVSFCDPNLEVTGRASLVGLPRPRRVRSNRYFVDSARGKFSRGLERLANVGARFLVTRLGPNRWVEDPVQQVREWPWLPLAAAVATGLGVGCFAVFVRRRIAGSRVGG